jgi:hypothetical protein
LPSNCTGIAQLNAALVITDQRGRAVKILRR